MKFLLSVVRFPPRPPLFSAQPFSVGRFHLRIPHTTRASGPFCVCRQSSGQGRHSARFAPVPPYLLSKPAPTSSPWHTQTALVVNHLRVCRWEWLGPGFARAEHNGKPARLASTSALGRERVVTVAVALTDLAITPLDEHLALLVDGDVPRTVNRLLLGVVDGGEAVVTFTAHTPLITAVNGNDPLVFSAHFKYSKVERSGSWGRREPRRIGWCDHVMATSFPAAAHGIAYSPARCCVTTSAP